LFDGVVTELEALYNGHNILISLVLFCYQFYWIKVRTIKWESVMSKF